jgi:uncharacterized membrane protein
MTLADLAGTHPDASANDQARSQDQSNGRGPRPETGRNVSDAERTVSMAAGAILALLGLGRRDLPGLLIAGVGGGLLYRGYSGHCPAYQALGLDTSESDATHIAESYLINKSPEELYQFWRNFENLPTIMTHLVSVQKTDDRRSHWVAKAPSIAGGQVEWDAEITADEPNRRIAWRSLEGSQIDHSGAVEFTAAPGDRGTMVRVTLDYVTPAGQIGRWIVKLLGEAPERQIKEDLRRAKRLLETGEIATINQQPRGTCLRSGGKREQFSA